MSAIEKLRYRIKMSKGRPISDDPVVAEIAQVAVDLADGLAELAKLGELTVAQLKLQNEKVNTMWRMYMEDE